MLYKVTLYAKEEKKEIILEAATPREAVEAAKGRLSGAVVARVEKAAKKTPSLFARAGPRDLELLCRRLHALVSAGVTLLESLETVAAQTERRVLREAVKKVTENVREGFSFSDAVRGSPHVFPPVFRHTVAAAEESGALEDALTFLAAHFEREAKFSEKLRQAASYPAVVAGFAVLVSLGLFLFVVPKFAALLADAGVPLPLVTKIMLGISSHAKEIFPAAAVFALLLVFLYREAKQREAAWSYLESVIARVPVVGRLAARAAAARVCRAAALMIRVGVPAVRSLEVAEGLASFSSFRKEIKRAREAVREGRTLAQGLAGAKWFPPTGVKMAAVGEESGRLPEMLEQSAALFESEVDLLVQKIPPLAEAGMVICVGGLVMFVLLSLFLPVFSVYQTVK